jgi:hypothetical protein
VAEDVEALRAAMTRYREAFTWTDSIDQFVK